MSAKVTVAIRRGCFPPGDGTRVRCGRALGLFPVGGKVLAALAIAVGMAACGGQASTDPASPPVEVRTLEVSAASVIGGDPVAATVTLTAAAPAGGFLVQVSSDRFQAAVPATVTVLAGASSAGFTVSTLSVATSTLVTIGVSGGGVTRTAALTLEPRPVSLTAVTVEPLAIEGGASATGRVTLSRAAGAGGLTVSLSSGHAALTVPANVAIAEGSSGGTFPVGTSSVAADTDVVVTARLLGVERTATASVRAAPNLVSVALDPPYVQGGLTSTGNVALNRPALPAGAMILLSSSGADAAVPPSVAVAGGATTASFVVTTSAVDSARDVTIRASLGGSTRSATLSLLTDPCALRTAGAQWFAFSSNRAGQYNVYTMRDDGTCRTQVTFGTEDQLFPSWSPAGTIAYMSTRDGPMQIYLRDLLTGTDTRLDTGALTATSPAFSPNGSQIAFEGYEPGVTTVSDIYVVPAAGGTPVKVTTGARYSSGPAWSPDGNTIYFVSNRVSGYNVWKVPAVGGLETMIAGTTNIIGSPAPTPDGASIALSRRPAGIMEVEILNLTSGVLRVAASQSDWAPTFSRTGERMIVTSSRGGDNDLWLIDTTTGSGLQQLTRDTTLDGCASYGPFP